MTTTLRIKGLAAGELPPIPIESGINVFHGPNGAGKSTILNCLLLGLSGRTLHIGGVPGALAEALTNDGTLEIDLRGDIEGSIASAARTTKATKIDGYDCRLARINLRGAPEEVRLFLAEQMIGQRPEGWDAKATATDLVDALKLATVAADEARKKAAEACDAVDPIVALERLLSTVIEISRNKRAIVDTKKKSLLSSQEELKKKEYPEIAKLIAAKRAEIEPLRQARAKLDAESAPVRELVAARARIQEELTGLSDPTRPNISAATTAEQAANTLEAKVVAPELTSALTQAQSTIAELTAQIQETEVTLKVLTEIATKATGEREQTERVCEALAGEACPVCAAPTNEDAREFMGRRLAEIATEEQAAIEAKNLCQGELTDLRNKKLTSRVEIDAANALNAAERALAIEKARVPTLRQEAQRIRKQIQDDSVKRTNLNARLATLPEPATESVAETESRALEITSLTDTINTSSDKLSEYEERQRQEEAATRLEREIAAAEAVLKCCTDCEKTIRGKRDIYVDLCLGPTREALERYCNQLGGSAIVDLGDITEGRKPFVGIDRAGRKALMSSMSNGERIGFLGTLAGAAIAGSKVPSDHRMLLIDGDGVTSQTLAALIEALLPFQIGTIIIAIPADTLEIHPENCYIQQLAGFVTAKKPEPQKQSPSADDWMSGGEKQSTGRKRRRSVS